MITHNACAEPKSFEGILLPRCYFCNMVPEDGIRGGVKVKKAFICRKCEEAIVAMEVGSPGYNIVITKLKELFK